MFCSVDLLALDLSIIHLKFGKWFDKIITIFPKQLKNLFVVDENVIEYYKNIGSKNGILINKF